MLNLFRLVTTLLFLTLIYSCGDDSTSPNNNDDPIEPTYEVEYNDQAIFINDDDGGAVIDLDTVNQIYTFDGTRFESTPEIGEVIIVEGKYMRKVTSVSSQGGNLVVETEDAALTDVITDGTIAWDVTPEWSSVSSLKMDGETILDLEDRITEKIETVISRDGIDHKIIIEPQMVDGKINSCTFEFVMAKKIAGDATAAFTAKGTVKLPNQQTRISISGGELESFKANNKGIEGNLELSLSAAGSKSGSHSVELPGIALSIPILFIPTPSGPIPLPIPVSIDVGIQFVTQITMPDVKSSATATSKLSYNADAGFQYEGTSVSSEGSLGNNKITDGSFDSGANIGIPVDVQFGVAFPRVGLNIAGQELAYVHTGFTTGSKLQWGPVCKSGYTKMVVEGGYELKVLGKTLAEKKKVFAQNERRVPTDGCE